MAKLSHECIKVKVLKSLNPKPCSCVEPCQPCASVSVETLKLLCRGAFVIHIGQLCKRRSSAGGSLSEESGMSGGRTRDSVGLSVSLSLRLSVSLCAALHLCLSVSPLSLSLSLSSTFFRFILYTYLCRIIYIYMHVCMHACILQAADILRATASSNRYLSVGGGATVRDLCK